MSNAVHPDRTDRVISYDMFPLRNQRRLLGGPSRKCQSKFLRISRELSPHLFGCLMAITLSGFQHVAPTAEHSGSAPRTGPQEEGGVLLPNGWRIAPAGEQVSLSTLPMSLALSPDEKHVLALNGGFLPPTISVIDLAATRETARVPVPDGWLGLTFNKAGDPISKRPTSFPNS